MIESKEDIWLLWIIRSPTFIYGTNRNIYIRCGPRAK